MLRPPAEKGSFFPDELPPGVRVPKDPVREFVIKNEPFSAGGRGVGRCLDPALPKWRRQLEMKSATLSSPSLYQWNRSSPSISVRMLEGK